MNCEIKLWFVAAISTLSFSGCASYSGSGHRPEVAEHVSPGVQITLREHPKRPYHIAYYDRDYTSGELVAFLMAYERDGERYGMSREPRIITITSTEKLLLYGYKDLLQPIVSFAKPRHVRLVCLDPPGSSIDAILLGLPHTQIGVPSSTRR